jgi:hypothetical protein
MACLCATKALQKVFDKLSLASLLQHAALGECDTRDTWQMEKDGCSVPKLRHHPISDEFIVTKLFKISVEDLLLQYIPTQEELEHHTDQDGGVSK